MHDVIIIGAGPAGLSAAIYAERFRLKTLVIGRVIGGLITSTHLVENWPGEVSITGLGLMDKVIDHAKSLGVELIEDEVIDVIKSKQGFEVKTSNKVYETKSIIIATGTEHRKLGVPGEKEYAGKGVSYCAKCDSTFFKDKVVGVVGGSDSAAKEALLLADYAKKVYIIYRKERIRAEPINAERVARNNKIEIIPNVNVKEIRGNKIVKSVLLDNGRELILDGVFIEIGQLPKTELARKLGCKLNDKGEVIIDRDSRTSVSGVYAAGDCTDSDYKQAITGSAEGVKAAFSAYEQVRGGM